jgi:hypothetical protein
LHTLTLRSGALTDMFEALETVFEGSNIVKPQSAIQRDTEGDEQSNHFDWNFGLDKRFLFLGLKRGEIPVRLERDRSY